ncbi:hypothetical protein, partial [Dysosmobacter sp.]
FIKVLKTKDFNGAGHPSWVSRAHPSFPLRRIYLFIDSLKACSKERAFCFCSQVRSRRRMGRMYLKAAVLWQTGTGG